jgi:hypothetical protein
MSQRSKDTFWRVSVLNARASARVSTPGHSEAAETASSRSYAAV